MSSMAVSDGLPVDNHNWWGYFYICRREHQVVESEVTMDQGRRLGDVRKPVGCISHKMFADLGRFVGEVSSVAFNKGRL